MSVYVSAAKRYFVKFDISYLAFPFQNATNDKKDNNKAYCLLKFSFFNDFRVQQ